MEFTIEGNEYRVRKLTAVQQLHVSRKLAGVLTVAFPAFVALAEKDPDDGVDIEKIFSSFGPAAEAIAAMPEAEVDFVCATCLAVVSRRQGSAWCQVWNERAKALQFEDIDLGAMMQMVFRVIQDSLGNFIQGLLAKLRAASPAA